MKIKAPIVIQMIRVLKVKSVLIIQINVKLATIFTTSVIEYQLLFVLISDINQRFVIFITDESFDRIFRIFNQIIQLNRLCNKHCGCNGSSSRKRRSTDEYELSFLDILAASSLKIARHRRNSDENDYSTKLNDLDSRMSDVLNSLARIPDKVNALNDSYNSLDAYLDVLEEAALGELFFLSHCLSKFQMMMFTNHIHVYVRAMTYMIFVQYDALTILLLNVNHVINPFVGHGHSGHHGRPVQNHVVMEKNHVIELLFGTMIEHLLKL